MGDIYIWWACAIAWHFGPDDNFVNKSVNRVNNASTTRGRSGICRGEKSVRWRARTGIDSWRGPSAGVSQFEMRGPRRQWALSDNPSSFMALDARRAQANNLQPL